MPRQLRSVFLEIALDQLPHVWRLPRFLPFGHRIAALIDLAFQSLCFFAGGGDRPIRPCSYGEPPFPRLDPIGQDEGAHAAAGDAHAEADHLLVIDYDILVLRLNRLHATFGKMRLHAFDPFRATQPRSFPVSKMLWLSLPMNGGNGRKPGEKGELGKAPRPHAGTFLCPHSVRRLPGFKRCRKLSCDVECINWHPKNRNPINGLFY